MYQLDSQKRILYDEFVKLKTAPVKLVQIKPLTEPSNEDMFSALMFSWWLNMGQFPHLMCHDNQNFTTTNLTGYNLVNNAVYNVFRCIQTPRIWEVLLKNILLPSWLLLNYDQIITFDVFRLQKVIFFWVFFCWNNQVAHGSLIINKMKL